MLRRVTWLCVLAVLLVLAGVGAGQSQAAAADRASPCDAMVMAAEHAPKPVHKDGAGMCRACGIDCPMHCAAIGVLPACSLALVVSRPAYPPSRRQHAAGCPPGAEHGPPRPLA